MQFRINFFLLLLIGVVAPASAQIYAGHSNSGSLVLSNFLNAETPTLFVSASMVVRAQQTAGFARDTRLAARVRAHTPIIDTIAREVGVSSDLLHAVISVESAYSVDAVSAKGAKGLMQLMPATARRFGVVDPFEPRSNVRGGALYLKWLIERFDGNLELVLAAYNAGEDAVIRAGHRVPQIDETLHYVPRVLARVKGGPG